MDYEQSKEQVRKILGLKSNLRDYHVDMTKESKLVVWLLIDTTDVQTEKMKEVLFKL